MNGRSDRLILVESGAEGLRAALMSDGRLEAIEIDRRDRPNLVGSVLRAQAARNLRGLGTIVKLPDGSEMLLDRSGPALAAGDSIPVQVARDPRGGKLGQASRSVALAGRALVHLPLESGIRVSRRFEGDTERRAALEAALADRPGGWILRRTAGLIDESDFQVEAAVLAAEGARMSEAGALPAPDAVRRLISDHGAPPPQRILVSGKTAERLTANWCRAFAPSLLPRIERSVEPFDRHDLDEAIAALASPRVPLASGGSLAIERTEALTAIDVNAGSEPNPLAANLAAVAEIARQLRLRHIGGIVVVDFVSLTRPPDRERLSAAFKAALADDPAQTYVLAMSSLGLVEMTRERRGPELEL